MPDAPPTMFAPALIAGDGQLTASWAELAAIWNEVNKKDGNAITAYNLRYGEFGSESWTEITSGITGASHTITDLTNGMNYAVQVRAVNAGGTGGWSASSTATPTATLTVPAAPTVPALEAGTGLLIATWTAPTDNGGSPITGYELRYRADDMEPWTIISSGIACARSEGQTEVCHFPFSSYSPYTIHSITADGANYQLRVRAVNAQGSGEWSESAMFPFPFATQLPAGESAVAIVPADIDNPLAPEIATELSVSLTTVGASNITVDNSGDITKVTSVATPNGVTPPTVDSSSGFITLTVTADTTAGTYVIYAIGADGRRFAEYFFVTESPTTNAELKTAVNAGITTWGNTVDLNYIITTAVTDMYNMFNSATTFNGDISRWDVSKVMNMENMFAFASTFNGDISRWDVSSLINMSNMFRSANAFNGDISDWDVSSVTNMPEMFSFTTTFNGDISGWDVSSVTNLLGMFSSASAFNGDISDWDVSSVTNMTQMFVNASAFNQNLESWGSHLMLDTGTPPQYTGTDTFMFNNSGVVNGIVDDPNTSDVETEAAVGVPSWYCNSTGTGASRTCQN